jgi:hypothetical protein
MPANLTPDYEKAEARLRAATTDDERLAALQDMLSTIPKHKGTEKMQADIKRRISQLRKAAARKGPSRGPDLFHVPKNGAGQAVLIGPPNSGKSSLVAITTNAPVKVAPYPYTTAVPAPGMWPYEDVQLQLVDTPPVTPEHVPGGLVGTIRAADVLLLVVDAADAPLEQAEACLAILAARNIEPVTIANGQLDPALPGRMSALLLANKADLAPAENIQALGDLYRGRLEVLPTSAASGEGLADLARRLWELFSLIRVYTKEPGKPADRHRPYTLPGGCTVEDLAREIHRELPNKMKYAKVWGDGRFPGQQVHRSEILRDKDVVEIHQ